jgi:ABC-type phosphate transport system permease subunit
MPRRGDQETRRAARAGMLTACLIARISGETAPSCSALNNQF